MTTFSFDSGTDSVDLTADITPSEGIALEVDSGTDSIDLAVDSSGGGTADYNALSNKPKLNGQTIIGDMQEIDPTVPDWSKASTKPTYTADEVGAVGSDNAIPLEELALLF